MILMVFLKTAAEVGFFYTLAGIIGHFFGLDDVCLLLSVIVFAVFMTLSYLLRNRKVLRFVPLLGLGCVALLPGFNLTAAIVMAPMAVYLVIIAAKDTYEPDRERQTDFFSLYWKLAIAFLVIAAVAGKMPLVKGQTIPLILIVLTCSVLLMRALRHDRTVYDKPSYQLVNLLIVAGVGVVAFLISSKTFLNSVWWVIKNFWSYVIAPVLIGAFYGLTWLLAKIFGNISCTPGFEEKEKVTLNTDMGLDFLKETNEEAVGGDIVKRVLIALGILIALAIVTLIVRYFIRNSQRRAESRSDADYRRRTPTEPLFRAPEPESGEVGKVRKLYGKFLKTCQANGVTIKKYYTSRDVNTYTSQLFDENDAEELRKIYIRARYKNEATQEDVEHARELVNKLSREQRK